MNAERWTDSSVAAAPSNLGPKRPIERTFPRSVSRDSKSGGPSMKSSHTDSRHDLLQHLPFLAVDLHGDILLDVTHRRRFYSEQQVFLNRHLEPLKTGNVRIQVLPV